MKRLLLMALVGTVAPGILLGCGDDDDSSAPVDQDGGLTPTELRDDVDGLKDDVDRIDTDVASLQDGLDGVSDGLSDAEGNIDELSMRVDDLEDVPSCSEAEQCIPDGVDLTQAGVGDLVQAVCQHEFDCCDEDEVLMKFGPGIESVDDCVDAFNDLINNGFSPDFLTPAGSIIRQVVFIARALNDTDAQIEIDADAVDACQTYIEEWECPMYEEPEEIEPAERCVPDDHESEEDPCTLHAVIDGLQELGELCTELNLGVDECADGLVCHSGICVEAPEAQERCVDDNDCVNGQDLFCNSRTGMCEERRGEGEDCAYIDPTFEIINASLDPHFDGDWRQSRGLVVECKQGLSCDPASNTCVSYCGAGAICTGNFYCPEDTICNFTEFESLFDSWGLGLCRSAIETGEECTTSDECASGRCMDDPETGDVDFKCAPAEPAGEDCPTPGYAPWDCDSGICGDDDVCAGTCADDPETEETEYDCPEDYYCDMATSDYTGYLRICRPKIADTETCDTNDDDSGHSSCESGFCDAGTTCTAQAASGGTCVTADQQCPGDEICVATTCTAPSEANGDCATRGDDECEPDLHCVSTATNPGPNSCKTGNEGVACDTADGDDDCNEGLFCVSGACETGEQDAPCLDESDCAEGFWCDTGLADPICKADLDDEADCSSATGFACGDESSCQSPPDSDPTSLCLSNAERSAGQYCAAHSQCADHLYCMFEEGSSGDGACADRKTAGLSCEPRFGGRDCFGLDCLLRHDQFICGGSSFAAETLLCDGS